MDQITQKKTSARAMCLQQLQQPLLTATHLTPSQVTRPLTCSATSTLSEVSSCTKAGTAFSFTTAAVCSEVPEVMLVSAQAASNWRRGCAWSLRKDTSRGRTPDAMTSLMGGLTSASQEGKKDIKIRQRGGNIASVQSSYNFRADYYMRQHVLPNGLA